MITFRQVLKAQQRADKLYTELVNARHKYFTLKEQCRMEVGQVFSVDGKEYVIVPSNTSALTWTELKR